MRKVFAFLLCSSAATAQEPLSAIDWLSDSLAEPPNFYIAPPTPHSQTLGTAIMTSSLDLVSREAIGLLPPDITGFPTRLWGDLAADQVIERLNNHHPKGVQELHALYRNVLLAQADPPLGASRDQSPLLTRINLLMQLGAMDEAETMIGLVTRQEPDIFAKWFEISLLANRTRAVCAALLETPDLSSDVATRVICLARGGDWNAAAITLSLSASIGDIERSREELLINFLDPELFEGAENPPIPEPLTAVDFALRESLGMPRPTTLPLMFLNVDMGLNAPQRRRMEAAERLVHSSAIPTSLLFAAYRGGRPASSGGIWERANAVQQLDRALVGNDDAALAEALQHAYQEMAKINMLPALAEEFTDALLHHGPSDALQSVAPMVQNLLLLENAPLGAWLDTLDNEPPAREMARVLSSRIPVLGLSPYDDPVISAIHAAFADQTPQLGSFAANAQLIENGRIGEVILVASDLLSNGVDSDPANIHQGLFLLRKAGQDGAARRVAIQLLLIDML